MERERQMMMICAVCVLSWRANCYVVIYPARCVSWSINKFARAALDDHPTPIGGAWNTRDSLSLFSDHLRRERDVIVAAVYLRVTAPRLNVYNYQRRSCYIEWRQNNLSEIYILYLQYIYERERDLCVSQSSFRIIFIADEIQCGGVLYILDGWICKLTS